MPKRWLLLILLVIVFISFSLMTYQSNRQHLLPLKPLHVVLNGFHDVKASLKEFLSSPFRRMLLREQENVRLREELAAMLKEKQAYKEALQENKRLRELLELKEREPNYITTARVIGRSSDFWSKTVILDKGVSEGIRKDMIAITEMGIAGKISSVFDSYALLLLINDISFSAAARLQDGRTEGILSGTGSRKCVLKYIPHEENVKEGAVVVTSGLDAFFPPGIPLGYVSRVNKKEAGVFQEIEITPFVDNAKLEVVGIIRKR
ncbi:MAG: rod shape-determining protein MreC [Nitrospirota bacterium]